AVMGMTVRPDMACFLLGCRRWPRAGLSVEDIPPRQAVTIPVSAYNTGRAACLLMPGASARREQRRLRPVGDIEAPYDLLDVRLDRAFGHVERVRDHLVCFAFGDQREDITLAARQRAPWCALGSRRR